MNDDPQGWHIWSDRGDPETIYLRKGTRPLRLALAYHEVLCLSLTDDLKRICVMLNERDALLTPDNSEEKS